MNSTENTDPPPAEYTVPLIFLRLPEVLKRVPLGRSAWYEAVKKGTAPAPVRLGGAAMWAEHEIEAMARRLMAKRDADQSANP